LHAFRNIFSEIMEFQFNRIKSPTEAVDIVQRVIYVEASQIESNYPRIKILLL
jgi:hypothetical protein